MRIAVALTAVVVMSCCSAAAADAGEGPTPAPAAADDDVRRLMDVVDDVFDAADSYRLAPGVRVQRSAAAADAGPPDVTAVTDREHDPEKYLVDKVARYADTHVLDVDFAEMFRSAGRTFIQLRE